MSVQGQEKLHIPVMLEEAIDYLNLGPGKIIVDATVGTGGHAARILEKVLPGGRLVGIDRDKNSLDVASERLKKFSANCNLVYANFLDIDKVLKSLKIKKVDGILFDLGVSSFQLEDPQRGFSFQQEGPLDMRLDQSSFISAYDLVNNLNAEEISSLLWNFGQERWHNRIAKFLVAHRQKYPVSTTIELSNIVVRAIPLRFRHYRIHPATRTFQAIRIAVNRELEVLETSINKVVDLLNPAGRLCIISFHSLEDRIVKINFKKFSAVGKLKVITPKPLAAKEEELSLNPSSRSAKLRVAERI